MDFCVVMTDNRWYRYLSILRPDEVNFWRPSGGVFRTRPAGTPFLFKLHKPDNFIAGGGFFLWSGKLPLSLAWDAFGQKNGAPNVQQLRELIRGRGAAAGLDPDIGCTILNEPFFLPREHWIDASPYWRHGIQTIKTYPTADALGRQLREEVERRLPLASRGPQLPALPLGREGALPGSEYLMRSRLGLGGFRVLVTDAYNRSCAVTADRTLPVLEATHIMPLEDGGPNRLENALLLRADLRILFDDGYLTVTPEYKVRVSRRLKERFDNGVNYYKLKGRELAVLPDSELERPGREFLAWHNVAKYQG